MAVSFASCKFNKKKAKQGLGLLRNMRKITARQSIIVINHIVVLAIDLLRFGCQTLFILLELIHYFGWCRSFSI